MLKKTVFYGLAAGALMFASAFTASAGTVRLSNGQFVQGEIVGDPTDDGINFKLTSTGGQIFLRWGQIHADDAKRLRKVEDPLAGLKLTVEVKGARVELVTGEVLEGYVEKKGSSIIFTNLRHKKREIPSSEIEEGGLIEDVMIDATAVMEPSEILAMEVADRPPVTAQDYYAFSRLAERLGLYQDAKAYIDDCLASMPSPKLQTLAEGFSDTLAELIKQEALLAAIKGARDFARKRQYQAALTLIDDVIKNAKPTGAIHDKLLDTRDEVDAEFTQFVIKEWYSQMNSVVSRNIKDLTADQAMGYARGQLEQGILAAIIAQTGSDQNDIRSRFDSRRTRIEKISKRRASFGADGWYDVVGGPLPSAGNINQNNPNAGSGGRNAGAGPGGGQGGRGGQGGQGGRGPQGGSRGSEGGRERDRDGFGDAKAPEGFQAAGRSPAGEGGDARQIEDLIRRAADAMGGQGRGGAAGGMPGQGGQGGQQAGGANQRDPNDPRWQVPEGVPSLRDWWTSASRTKKKQWIIAYYVLNGRSMIVVDQKYDTLFYK